MDFTNEMVFPSNFTAILNDKNVSRKLTNTEPVKDKRALADELTGKSLLSLSLKSYVNDTFSDNLTGWTVTNADSR